VTCLFVGARKAVDVDGAPILIVSAMEHDGRSSVSFEISVAEGRNQTLLPAFDDPQMLRLLSKLQGRDVVSVKGISSIILEQMGVFAICQSRFQFVQFPESQRPPGFAELPPPAERQPALSDASHVGIAANPPSSIGRYIYLTSPLDEQERSEPDTVKFSLRSRVLGILGLAIVSWAIFGLVIFLFFKTLAGSSAQ